MIEGHAISLSIEYFIDFLKQFNRDIVRRIMKTGAMVTGNHDALVLREALKGGFAMISANTAFTNTSKGKIMRCSLFNRFVYPNGAG